MWHTGRSERTCRLPACLTVSFTVWVDWSFMGAIGYNAKCVNRKGWGLGKMHNYYLEAPWF